MRSPHIEKVNPALIKRNKFAVQLHKKSAIIRAGLFIKKLAAGGTGHCLINNTGYDYIWT